jgi:hypothetical protein
MCVCVIECVSASVCVFIIHIVEQCFLSLTEEQQQHRRRKKSAGRVLNWLFQQGAHSDWLPPSRSSLRLPPPPPTPPVVYSVIA